MLIDLETFNVDVSHKCCSDGRDCQDSDEQACFDRSPQSTRSNKNGSCTTEKEKYEDNIAVEAMEPDKLVPNDGKELPRKQQADGDDCGKMYEHANTTSAMRLIFPISYG